MHTYQTITDHKRPTDHYRHTSQLLTSNATSCPGKVCHVAASANRSGTGGVRGCYRALRCDRRGATSNRRALHGRCRRSPTSRDSERRGRNTGLALVVRSPADWATTYQRERARSTPQARSDPVEDPQLAFSTLRASPAASGGRAFAHSSRRREPTAFSRCAASSGCRAGSAARATLAARDLARRLGDRTR
jgi:hypothetical protein